LRLQKSQFSGNIISFYNNKFIEGNITIERIFALMTGSIFIHFVTTSKPLAGRNVCSHTHTHTHTHAHARVHTYVHGGGGRKEQRYLKKFQGLMGVRYIGL
jgi:hypothetical protein